MRLFLLTLLNGVTLGALYFIVASGFTLIFGLMRNVNLAHGSLYLLGGYLGYGAIALTDSWLAGLLVAFLAMALVGIALQVLIFRQMEGQDLRQTLVTIALSIVLADLMLWVWGGGFYQIQTPEWLYGAVSLPIVVGATSSGDPVYLQYPMLRLFILAFGDRRRPAAVADAQPHAHWHDASAPASTTATCCRRPASTSSWCSSWSLPWARDWPASAA